MRLEIIVDNEEPLIFPLKKSTIFIGASASCDIVLNTSGVSRKHVAVVNESDNFYVIDQGSTNGSYINEERLVPGRKVEFTSFFPVRLGDNVLLTLLSDEDSHEGFINLVLPAPEAEKPDLSASRSESTTMISLKDLKSASTEGLVKKRKENIARRKTQAAKPAPMKSKDKSRMLSTQIMAFLLIGVAFYYNFYMIEPVVEEAPAVVGEVTKAQEVLPATPAVAPGVAKIDPSDYVAKSIIPGMIHDLKCTSDLEKYLCGAITGANVNPYGVVQIGSTVVVMVDGSPYFARASKIIEKTPPRFAPSSDPALPPTQVPPSQKDFDSVVHALFVAKAVPADLNVELLKDFKIFIALFKSQTEVSSVAPLTPEALMKLKTQLNDKDLQRADEKGKAVLFYLDFLISPY